MKHEQVQAVIGTDIIVCLVMATIFLMPNRIHTGVELIIGASLIAAAIATAIGYLAIAAIIGATKK